MIELKVNSVTQTLKRLVAWQYSSDSWFKILVRNGTNQSSVYNRHCKLQTTLFLHQFTVCKKRPTSSQTFFKRYSTSSLLESYVITLHFDCRLRLSVSWLRDGFFGKRGWKSRNWSQSYAASVVCGVPWYAWFLNLCNHQVARREVLSGLV